MADVIRIKKKDVRKILSLYTMEGLSQKETGRVVFGRDDLGKVSSYTVVQRVLHYFGLNMEHRRDYTHEGLTEDIIDRILENRTIAFPLAIPVEGRICAAVNFDVELNKYLGQDRVKWNTIGHLKDFAVVVLLLVFTYFLVVVPNEKTNTMILFFSMLGWIAFLVGIEGTEGRGLENDGKREIFDVVITFLYLVLMMGIGIFLS